MRSISVAVLLFAVLALASCGSSGTPSPSAQTYIYVGNFDDRIIQVFAPDAATGVLSPLQTEVLATPPVALAVHNSKQFLFYTDSLQVFPLQVGNDGKITAIGSPVDAGVGCVALESVGDFVYTGCSTKIAAFKVGTNGALTPVAGSPFSFVGGTASMSVDPSGHDLYIVGSGATISGYLKSFALDPVTGAVAPGSGDLSFANAPLSASAVDRSGKYLYLVTSSVLGGPASNALNGYAIQANAGLQSISNTSLSFGSNLLARSPAADVLFVSYDATPKIVSYTYDANGTATATPYSANLPIAASQIKVDASGKLLLVLCQGHQGLRVLLTDATGKLTDSGNSYMQGKNLMTVTSMQR